MTSQNEINKNVARAYREASDSALMQEPSVALDDAIRAAARRAVSSKPHQIKQSWLQRHTAPLAMAATLLLTSSIIMVGLNENPDVVNMPTAPTAPTTTAKPTSADATSLVQKAEPVAEITAAPDASRTKKDEAKIAIEPTPPNIKMSPMPAKPIAAATAPASVGTATSAAASTAAPAIAPSAAPAAPPAPPAHPVPAAIMADAVRDDAAAGSKNRAEKQIEKADANIAQPRENASVTIATTTRAAAPIISMPPPPQAPVIAQMADKKAEPAVAGNASVSAPRSDGALSKLAAKKDLAELEAEPAPTWIARMKTLLADGKTKELHEQLLQFRKRYPKVELPPALAEEWAKIDPAKNTSGTPAK